MLHGVEGRARGVDKAGGAERTTQGRHGLQGRVEHAAQSRQQNSWHHGKQHACMNIAHTYQHNKQAQEDIAHSTHIRLDVALPPHPAVARERGPGKSETLTMAPRARGVHHCIPIPLRVACANSRAGAVLLAPAGELRLQRCSLVYHKACNSIKSWRKVPNTEGSKTLASETGHMSGKTPHKRDNRALGLRFAPQGQSAGATRNPSGSKRRGNLSGSKRRGKAQP